MRFSVKNAQLLKHSITVLCNIKGVKRLGAQEEQLNTIFMNDTGFSAVSKS